MKPIGLVFIVINLVLAAAFLGYAAHGLATTEDLKQQVADLEDDRDTKVAEATSRANEANTNLTTVKNDRDILRESRDALQNQIADLESERDDLKRKNDELSATLDSIDSGLGDISSSVTKATESAERAKDAQLAAEQERNDALDEASAAVQAQRDAEDALALLQKDYEELEIDMADTRAKLSRSEAQVAVARELGFIESDVQPLVAGRVIDINNSVSPGLVALNVGSDRGVERGMTFEIYSENSYKGRVRVSSVVSDKCSAVVVIDGEPIERGDYAATNL